MKYLKIIIALLILVGCSNDSDNSESASTDGTGGSMAIFALKGDYLYAVDNAKLNIFSLINTAEPVVVNEINVGFNIETLFSKDDYLFIGSRNGMYIYSLQHPENPELLSTATHFTSCDPVVANDTHAFVTLHSGDFCGNSNNELLIYDIANINQPILLHSRQLVYPKGLALYGDFLFICDDTIKIFDITDPRQPQLKGNIPKQCNDLIIKGNELYAIGDHIVCRYTLDAANISNLQLQSQINF